MNKIKEITENANGETKALLTQLVKKCAEQALKNEILTDQLKKLNANYQLALKKIYGQSSEKDKVIPKQLLCDVYDEFELTALEVAIEEQMPQQENTAETTPKTAKKKGRKPLPKNLPRTVVERDLPDDEKICGCGSTMHCIGADTREELEYTPAKVEVFEYHFKKYCCASCSDKHENDPSHQTSFKKAQDKTIIPKSFASPSLLAAIAIAKFCDHMPLYRQEASFKRIGIELCRQSMSTWMIKSSHATVPLMNLIEEKLLEYDVAFADETPLQVLKEPGREAKKKSYMWNFIGGPPDQRIIIYQYHQTRSASVPETFFEGYQGALHCDGYGGYSGLLSKSTITGCNCWAHVRRKFLESIPKSEKITGVAAYVLACITALYKIETELRESCATVEIIKKIRQKKSKPILEKLKTFLDEKSKTVPPKSKLGEAIAYTLNRWKYLITYVEDGRYEIDNNRAERGIKPFVMGRKAWLFANSMAGAYASCRLFSLIETAKANNLNPNQYLTHIFKELPNCNNLEDYEALLPWNVKLE
jgi:transposase